MLETIADTKTIAGIVVEPLIQGVAGMRIWPKGMLRDLRNFCNRKGILLILDEVMTGFGRTRTMFACQQEEVIPDFLVLAKGITGGVLPLTATMTSEKIYETFLETYEEQKTFYYGHSYTANTIACAAALASLEIFEKEAVLEHFSQTLNQLKSLPYVAEIRQCGLVAGIEVMQDPHSKIPFPWQNQTGAKICYEARQHGLLTRPILDTIVLMSPLCASKEEIDQAVEALCKSLETWGVDSE